MSVLIRGMKLPDNCLECPLETDYGTCGYYSLFVEAGHDSEVWKRRDDCPLVEVPPHGRLIDADDMFVEFVIEGQGSKRYKIGETWKLNGEEIRAVISRLPTIIPAEEDE